MALEVKQLSCIKGRRVLFRNLTFSLNAGQLILIQGDNGAGKTTLLRMLAGLASPDKGHVTYAQQPIALHQTNLSYVGHKDAVHASLSVRENIAFLMALTERTVAQSALDVLLKGLDLFDYAHSPCDQLSQGQRRKVSLCALLAKALPLWILDEPTTALDERSSAWFYQAMATHLRQGGMVIMASHTPIEYPVPQQIINLSGSSTHPQLRSTPVGMLSPC